MIENAQIITDGEFCGYCTEDIDINILPTVTPQQKTGHLIFTKTMFDKHGCTVECSDCHKKWKTYDTIRFEKEYKYCPNCGAKMAESEVKE